jgi:GT2 family glycosyltransferase
MAVVICTKDRPTELARAIASIRDSGPAGRAAEIVVVEEGNTPRQIPGVRYIHLPQAGRGFGYARNAGLSAADADLVLFMDDDCEAEQGWVEALSNPLRSDPRVLGVAGAVLVRKCGPFGYAENILGFPGGGLRYLHEAGGKVVPTQYLSTCNCAYRRDAVLRVGGFPEDARLGGEDFLLAERITALGPCVYVPTAQVYHRPRDRWAKIFRWFVRRGQSEIRLLTLTADRGKLARFLLRSSWSVRALVICVVLARWPQLAILLPPAGIFYYGLILWRFRFARAYPSHRRAWWLVPIVKITMDLGAELGRWRGLLSRGRR